MTTTEQAGNGQYKEPQDGTLNHTNGVSRALDGGSNEDEAIELLNGDAAKVEITTPTSGLFPAGYEWASRYTEEEDEEQDRFYGHPGSSLTLQDRVDQYFNNGSTPPNVEFERKLDGQRYGLPGNLGNRI